ncbi:hypothetical protein CoNPh17_CDS0227 [Staphylococcus phage S-CoN_Ph17]|nr:hypothetical protein CoNPh17_CDS0227 [Staphylococcus phage S-CoN_Ph17]
MGMKLFLILFNQNLLISPSGSLMQRMLKTNEPYYKKKF